MADNDMQEVAIEKKFLIHRAQEVLYSLLRNQENFPFIFTFIENVTALDKKTFRWSLTITDTEKLITTAEIIRDEPFGLIEWHSQGSSEILHQGLIRIIKKTHTLCEVFLNFRIYFPPMYDGLSLLKDNNLQSQVAGGMERFKIAVEANQFPRKSEIHPELRDWPPGQTDKHFPIDE